MNGEVLLVEGDSVHAELVQSHLRRAGFSVHGERNGAGAMRAIGGRAWDLVLLDLTLPEGDGLDICRHLCERHPRLPMIVVSARASEAQCVLGLEMGADDYIAKPFSMLELVARVRALLRRAQQRQAPDAPLRFGSLRIDPRRRELRCGDAHVALTLREFDLLNFLALHPGQVFSRADLLDQVWGPGFDGYEHTVNSHINRLRSKIEADAHEPCWIRTVRGVGYRFDPDGATARTGVASRRP